MKQSVLVIRNFSFQYAGSDTPVLRDINLTIDAGQCVCMTGATGSGKSTLVLAIMA